jgi:hypothetical protein
MLSKFSKGDDKARNSFLFFILDKEGKKQKSGLIFLNIFFSVHFFPGFQSTFGRSTKTMAASLKM